MGPTPVADVVSAVQSEVVVWLFVLLAPALVVFAVHLLILSCFERATVGRVRRLVGREISRGDIASLRRAEALAVEAEVAWPCPDLWSLGKGITILRQRAERAIC